MMDCRNVTPANAFSFWTLNTQRDLMVLIFSHVFDNFSFFLESTWSCCSFSGGMDTAVFFSAVALEFLYALQTVKYLLLALLIVLTILLKMITV